nr:MAG TPA: hypothetical protein [Bacteriophage sp.]
METEKTKNKGNFKAECKSSAFLNKYSYLLFRLVVIF